jgi:hypothetical protein
VANVGIRLFELLTKRAAPKEQGMVAGGVFRPIPSETPLGLTRHHPYDPFCNFKHGRNPIFAKVMAILTELSAKSGSLVSGSLSTGGSHLPVFSLCPTFIRIFACMCSD